MSILVPLMSNLNEDVPRLMGKSAGGMLDPLVGAIRSLFSKGEQGALYYFTPDFAGLYQDAAGITPVTAVGQPVGLMLDRRFGLARGVELGFTSAPIEAIKIQNGQVAITDLGDRYRLTRTAAEKVKIQDIEVISQATVAGAVYEAEFNILAAGAENNAWTTVLNGGATSFVSPAYTGASKRRTIAVTTGAGSGKLHFRLGVSRGSNPTSSVAGDWIEVGKRFSVREVPGNHASQPTTTARPLLVLGESGKLCLEGDGVDDFMQFPTIAGPQGAAFAAARDVGSVGTTGIVGGNVGTYGLLRAGGTLRMYPGGASSGLANNVTPRSAVGSVDGVTSRCTTDSGVTDVSVASTASFNPTYLFAFGATPTGFAKARIYGAGTIDRLPTEAERGALHAFLNKCAGIAV